MSPQTEPTLKIYHNAAMLYEETARAILRLTREKDGPFSIALAGGVTPKGLYARMADAPFVDLFDWNQLHFFWGDERWVQAAEDRSNQLMVREALLKKVEVPESNIHPIAVDKPSPEESAKAYEENLRGFFQGTDFPAFDLVILGLGEDGHTASLFPGDPALEEKTAWTAAARKGSAEPRITLTLPVLNHAKNVIFLVSGTKKKDILKQLLEPTDQTPDYPARRVKPANGQVFIFVDRNAAAHTK